jgi:hypothetical protein
MSSHSHHPHPQQQQQTQTQPYNKHDKHNKRSTPIFSIVVFLVIVALCILVSVVVIKNGRSAGQTILPQPAQVNIRNPAADLVAVGGAVVKTEEKKAKKKIAYAITVTKDGHFLDGALVLGYSALKVCRTALMFLSSFSA